VPQHDQPSAGGEVYDCDFNQQLDMQWKILTSSGVFLWDVDPDEVDNREIMTGNIAWLQSGSRFELRRRAVVKRALLALLARSN